MNFHDDNGKNQRIVTLGAAELGMAGLLFTFGTIFIILGFFHIRAPALLQNPIPAIGFFMSLGWILVSWKLIESADKARDVRERRRFALYWISYASLITLSNAGIIILFATLLILKKYVYSTLITCIIISTAVLLVRGYIFVSVIRIYSKELALKPDSKNNRVQRNIGSQERNSQRSVVVTAV